MSDNRKNRDFESREKTNRYVYVPPNALPDPTPVPGMSFRWIGTHLLGASNPTNASRQMREGWVPVKAIDHPELMIEGNALTGNVEIGGLMLCSMPSGQVQARKEYYQRHSAEQMESVDNSFMRNSDSRMPLFSDRKSTSTGGFGTGSK